MSSIRDPRVEKYTWFLNGNIETFLSWFYRQDQRCISPKISCRWLMLLLYKGQLSSELPQNIPVEF